MKFSADKSVLYEAISGASKACAVKSALSILDGVMLSLSGDKLTVTGYDLEVGIRITVQVDGGEDGVTVTDPKLLAEMVRKMPGSSVDFKLDSVNGKDIKITSGKSLLTIPCKSGNDFPNIVELKKDFVFEIKEKLLKDMLTRVEFSTCKSDSNPSLMGIKMEITDNNYYSVATDGNRLAARYCVLENIPDAEFIIPEKAVSSLIRSLSDDDKNSVSISVDKNQISVTKENYMIISRLLDGKFVNYKRILEAPFPRVIGVNAKELALSMERCLLLMSDKIKTHAAFSFSGDTMKINCKTTIGSIEEQIQVSVKEGDFADFNICFNPRFLLEALQKAAADSVRIGFDGPFKPFKIIPDSDTESGDFIFIVVPIRSQ